MKRFPRFLRAVAFATACAVGFATGAAAQVVEVPEPSIGVEDFGTGLDAATLLASLPLTSRDPAAGLPQEGPEAPVGSIYRLDPARGLVPVTLAAGSGSETRLGVDVGAANAASEGWPWYGKAALIVGCVAVAGLAVWAVVEACDSGGSSHDHDSSSYMPIGIDGNNNIVIIRDRSPSYQDNSNRSDNSTSGGEW